MKKFIDMMEDQASAALLKSQKAVSDRIAAKEKAQRDAEIKARIAAQKAATVSESRVASEYQSYLSEVDSVIYEDSSSHTGAVRDGGRFVLDQTVGQTGPETFAMSDTDHKAFIAKVGKKGIAKVLQHAPGFYDLYFGVNHPDDLEAGDVVRAISGKFIKPA